MILITIRKELTEVMVVLKCTVEVFFLKYQLHELNCLSKTTCTLSTLKKRYVAGVVALFMENVQLHPETG